MNSSYDILVKFRGADGLKIRFKDTCITNQYRQLLKTNYCRSRPLFRDYAGYSVQRMLELARQAQEFLQWDWSSDCYDTQTEIRLHKDLEQFLARGFANIPAELDDLMHEIHICLHSQSALQQRNILQLEWFNDDGFELPEEFEHVHDVALGHVKLQNPYVGHTPWLVYSQQDNIDIPQTCRFHDFVRPGFAIIANPNAPMSRPFDLEQQQQYVSWFKTHAPEWVEQHGIERLLHYAGDAVIGHTLNPEVIVDLVKQPVIEFEHMEFMY